MIIPQLITVLSTLIAFIFVIFAFRTAFLCQKFKLLGQQDCVQHLVIGSFLMSLMMLVFLTDLEKGYNHWVQTLNESSFAIYQYLVGIGFAIYLMFHIISRHFKS